MLRPSLWAHNTTGRIKKWISNFKYLRKSIAHVNTFSYRAIHLDIIIDQFLKTYSNATITTLCAIRWVPPISNDDYRRINKPSSS